MSLYRSLRFFWQNSSTPMTREAGAVLVCLSSFSHTDAAADLLQKILCGDAAVRLGAVKVYARNLCNTNVQTACVDGLLSFLDHQDEAVRREIGMCSCI